MANLARRKTVFAVNLGIVVTEWDLIGAAVGDRPDGAGGILRVAEGRRSYTAVERQCFAPDMSPSPREDQVA
jgi:hypothetical protein